MTYDRNFFAIFGDKHLVRKIYEFVPGITKTDWIETAKTDDKRLALAIKMNHTEIINTLVEQKLNMNKISVMAAAEHKMFDLAYYIMTVLNNYDIDISYWVGYYNYTYLFDKFVSNTKYRSCLLDGAAAAGNLEAIKYFIKIGLSYHKTILDTIAHGGLSDVLDILLQHKSTNMFPKKYHDVREHKHHDIDKYAIYGYNYAVLNGHIKVIEVLLKHRQRMPREIMQNIFSSGNLEIAILILQPHNKELLDNFDWYMKINISKCKNVKIILHMLKVGLLNSDFSKRVLQNPDSNLSYFEYLISCGEKSSNGDLEIAISDNIKVLEILIRNKYDMSWIECFHYKKEMLNSPYIHDMIPAIHSTNFITTAIKYHRKDLVEYAIKETNINIFPEDIRTIILVDYSDLFSYIIDRCIERLINIKSCDIMVAVSISPHKRWDYLWDYMRSDIYDTAKYYGMEDLEYLMESGCLKPTEILLHKYIHYLPEYSDERCGMILPLAKSIGINIYGKVLKKLILMNIKSYKD